MMILLNFFGSTSIESYLIYCYYLKHKKKFFNQLLKNSEMIVKFNNCEVTIISPRLLYSWFASTTFHVLSSKIPLWNLTLRDRRILITSIKTQYPDQDLIKFIKDIINHCPEATYTL